MWCDVMWCDVMVWCGGVMWCDVVWCDVMVPGLSTVASTRSVGLVDCTSQPTQTESL